MARNTLAPGGYIGGEPPRRPYFNQLSGVWKLEDAMERQRAGTWANPLGIEDLFSTYLYTGNSSTQAITNGIDLAGEGGLVWIKNRTNVGSHALFDTVRGATKDIRSNSTSAESSNANYLTAFNSNGFSLGSDNLVNGTAGNSGGDYASWTFRKAPKFFDVVTYTGDGVAGRTVAHNLGSAPGCIIIKKLNQNSNWQVYHQSLGASAFIIQNLSNVQVTGNTDRWNSTSPTSTVFTLGNSVNVNDNGDTYVAYLFAHDAGGFGDSGDESVVKCGSFSGTGFVNLGWEPQWIMIKPYSQTYNWEIYDNMRGMGQPAGASSGQALRPNTSSAESSGSSISFEATGFTQTTFGASYPCIYIAIRRGPMKAPELGTSVMNTVLYTGSNSAQTITGVGFSPDTVWLKCRTQGANNSWWFDRVRGAYSLDPPSLQAESNRNSLYTFDYGGMDGFRLPSGGHDGSSSGQSHVGWCFKRAPSVFDCVAYTGTGSSTLTLAHNLGVEPEFIIQKCRSNSFEWWCWHKDLSGATGYIWLQSNAAKGSSTSTWGNTLPTTTQFTVGGGLNTSARTFVTYLFATCPGVSKVGTYSGSNSTVNIDCGFTTGARWVMIKRTDSTGHWYVWDTARGIVSGNDPFVLASQLSNENSSTDYIDPYSPGFSLPGGNPDVNTSGGTYIFLAIA